MTSSQGPGSELSYTDLSGEAFAAVAFLRAATSRYQSRASSSDKVISERFGRV
jgi:hypothetical protein